MEVAASEDEVEESWGRWPSANIGIVTGRVSGIVVLDVDPRSGGGLALADLEERWAQCLPRLRCEPPAVGAICGSPAMRSSPRPSSPRAWK